MKGAQSGKARDLQRPFPGCMGGMIGIFDLGSGLAGPERLSEKAHRDGSPVHRNQADVVKAMDPAGVPIEDNQISSEVRSSSKKAGGTPINMIIVQEMSKDTEPKQMPPNVVARLMGLDALPFQKAALNADVSSHEAYSHETLADALRCYQQQEDCCNEDPVPCEIQSCAYEKECKDVYEIRQKPSNPNQVENLTEKRMALVRQKFLEAKSLATDEKLIRSKEFQDALEVLSSNRDLFLRFLDDPNSLFSKHLQEYQTSRPLSQPRRITVLKPARTSESEDDRQVKIHQHPSAEANRSEVNKHHWNSSFTHRKAGNVSRPTRIVVLKPSLGKLHEIKNMSAYPVPSRKILDGRDFYGDIEPGEAMRSDEVATHESMESREVAKESSNQIQESLNSNRREDVSLSSVLSNRYVGDDSSLNRSGNNCTEEVGCSINDIEIATPTSRYPWNCTNRSESPHSVSSSSRASYSPESLVIREAKKRLSERWALVASNEISHEQRREPSSSTLGEMLAIPEVNKEEESDGPAVSSINVCGDDQDLLSIGGTVDEYCGEESPRKLSRSKSLPISSLFCGGTVLKEKAPVSLISKPILPESVGKLKSGKLSFKGRVSSLFFSKIKKTGGQKYILGPLGSSDVHSGRGGSIIERGDNLPLSSHLGHLEESDRVSSTGNNGPRQQTPFVKAAVSLEKTCTSGMSRENQDQPSPISILEAPFKDRVKQFPESSIVGNPQALSRAPMIESLARSLQTSLPKTTTQSTLLSEEDRFAFVQKLLSSAGLDRKKSKTVLSRWHSLDSPLDPMLRYDFLSRKEDEANCRVRRSNQKMLYDCVNAALSEIGHRILVGAYPWASRAHDVSWKGVPDAPLREVVWGLVSDWSSGEGEWASGEAQNDSPVGDIMVKMEITGRAWVELMWLEIDEFGKEIGGELLDELVEEAMTDLTDGFL